MTSMTLTFDSFTVFHANVSGYAALIFKPKKGRRNAVQNPVSIISRKDGTWTIKARNAANTVTGVDLSNGTLFGVDADGKVTALTVSE